MGRFDSIWGISTFLKPFCNICCYARVWSAERLPTLSVLGNAVTFNRSCQIILIEPIHKMANFMFFLIINYIQQLHKKKLKKKNIFHRSAIWAREQSPAQACDQSNFSITFHKYLDYIIHCALITLYCSRCFRNRKKNAKKNTNVTNRQTLDIVYTYRQLQ